MWMEEKSIMTKTGKSNPRKRNSNTEKSLVIDAAQQPLPSEKVFDAIPIAIISVNWAGQIQSMNRAATSILGVSDGELKPEEWSQAFGFYLDDGVMPYPPEKLPIVRALRGETVVDAEEMILRKDGNVKGIWLSFSAE